MWYAPIGSVEYIKTLHNDIVIKRYILSEQRYKSEDSIPVRGLKPLSEPSVSSIETQNRGSASKGLGAPKASEAKRKGGSAKARKTRLKGCAVNVRIIRSFNKTNLDVVTYVPA